MATFFRHIFAEYDKRKTKAIPQKLSELGTRKAMGIEGNSRLEKNPIELFSKLITVFTQSK